MELYLEAESLIKGVSHLTTNLANLSSLIYNSLPDVNWAGFYLLEGDKLVLGPFQGKPACIEIPLGKVFHTEKNATWICRLRKLLIVCLNK